MKLLALALVARALIRYQRARRTARDAEANRTDTFARDLGDPVQGFDEASELQGIPLEVDAQSSDDIAAAQDLAELELAVDQVAEADGLVIATSGRGDGGDSDLELEEEEEDSDLEQDDSDLEEGYSALEEQQGPRDAGDLYGAHTPVAVDREHPDDDLAFVEGQNWVEALETSAIEGGAEPERELDSIIDDEEALRPPHPSTTRDVPVADHGSGGRRGL
jgi:hypothetical protein